MRAQLLGRDAQVAAVKIDRGAPDLLDEGARQPACQVLAAGLVELPREALAQLLRGGGNRVEKPHDAPQVVPLLGQMQCAAPAIEPHELRHRYPITERKGAD